MQYLRQKEIQTVRMQPSYTVTDCSKKMSPIEHGLKLGDILHIHILTVFHVMGSPKVAFIGALKGMELSFLSVRFGDWLYIFKSAVRIAAGRRRAASYFHYLSPLFLT